MSIFNFRAVVCFVACGFGSGLAQPAPGTWGTLAGILIAAPFWMLNLPVFIILLLLISAFILGIYLCDAAARALGKPDHPSIVWDEFVGVWWMLFLLPESLRMHWGTLWSVIVVFLLFRLFDIIKPFPIRYLDQRISGGFGIMLDDFVAAIMGTLVLWTLSILIY